MAQRTYTLYSNSSPVCEVYYKKEVTFLSHKVFNSLPFHVVWDVANENSVTINSLLLYSACILVLRIGVESVLIPKRRDCFWFCNILLLRRCFLFFCSLIVISTLKQTNISLLLDHWTTRPPLLLQFLLFKLGKINLCHQSNSTA